MTAPWGLRYGSSVEEITRVSLIRHMAVDVVRALAVLAVVFLSFAHAPVVASGGAHDVLTAAVDLSFCGDAPSGDDGTHAPCHACRIGGGADIPPPSCASVSAPLAFAPVVFHFEPTFAAPALEHLSAHPRAPPVLV
jgi:hypothetical protein